MAGKATAEDLLKKLSEQLDEMGTLVKTQEEQIQKFGETSTKTGTEIGKQDARIQEIGAEITDMKGKLEEERKRAEDLERRLGRPGFGPPESAEKSAGMVFVESDAYKEMKANGERSSKLVPIRGFFRKELTSDPASAGVLVQPERLAEIIAPPDRAFRIRDLLTVDTIDSNSLEYVVEVGFANLYTLLTSATLVTDTVLEVENAQGFFAGQVLDVNGVPAEVESVNLDDNEVTLTGQIGAVKAIGDPVTSRSFAGTEETKTKPKMNISFELKDVGVKTLAHWIPASRQILEDAGQLRGYIDGRLIYGLGLAEERQILYGPGTGQSLQGIMTNPAVQTYNWSDGVVGDTQIDCFRRSLTLARLAEYPVTGGVVHPNDWADIELVKGEDGHYVWLSVGDGNAMRLFRVSLVETTAINSGDFLIGAFRLAATLYDKEQAGVRIAEQHEDFFIKNMVAILAEQRETLATFRPEGFVAGKFDEAPS